MFVFTLEEHLGLLQGSRAESFLALSFGEQNYTATYLPTREEVDEDFIGVRLEHRRWIAQSWGIFGQAEYTQILQRSQRLGLTAGFMAAL